MTQRIAIFAFFALFLFSHMVASAQASDTSRWIDRMKKKRHFYALPSVYYTPETRWAFGVGALYYFKTSKDSAQRISSIRMSAAYTQNKQVLFSLPWSVFTKDNQHVIEGVAAFYRYPYFFKGFDYDTVQQGYKENYDAQFPRLKLAFLKRFGKSIFTGPTYYFQQTQMRAIDPNGLLYLNKIPGYKGSLVSAFGWQFRYDTRDHILASQKGSFIKLSFDRSDRFFGADHDFTTTTLDARHFIDLKGKQVLAMQTFHQWIVGIAPFNRLSMLGNDMYMRGYKNGTYRASHISTFQAEYRTGYWGPFGLVGFVGAGLVYGPQIPNSRLLESYGAGLRVVLDKKERIVVRLDYGRGKFSSSEFYFTVNEAF